MIIEVKNFSELKSHLTNSKQYNLSVVSVSTRCIPIKENKRLDYWFDWTLEDVENNNIYKFNLDSYSKDFADFIENANVKIDNKEILCYLLYLGYKITNKNFSDFDVMIAKSKYFGVFNYVPDKYTLEPLYNKRLKMLRAKIPFTFRDKTDLDSKISDFIKNVLCKEMEFTEGMNNETYLRNFIKINVGSVNAKFCKAILDTINTLNNYKSLEYLDYLKYFRYNCGNIPLESILRSHNIEVNASKDYLMSFDLNHLLLHYYEYKVHCNDALNKEEFYNNILNRYNYLKTYLNINPNFVFTFTDKVLEIHENLDIRKDTEVKDNTNRSLENLKNGSYIKFLFTLAVYYRNNMLAFERYMNKFKEFKGLKNLVIKFSNDYFSLTENFKSKSVMNYILKILSKDLSTIKDSSITLFYNSSNKLVFKVNNNIHPTDAYKLITNSICKELPLLVNNCNITCKLNECFKVSNKKLDMNFFNNLKIKYPNKLQHVINIINKEALNC